MPLLFGIGDFSTSANAGSRPKGKVLMTCLDSRRKTGLLGPPPQRKARSVKIKSIPARLATEEAINMDKADVKQLA